jgi:cysteine-rich repeat protein
MAFDRYVSSLAARSLWLTVCMALGFLAEGCSALNRSGPIVTCEDLGGGRVNDCSESIIARCVDGFVAYENCMDGFSSGNDICTAGWQKKGAYRCAESVPLPVSCGDSAVAGAEECDDGNATDGDGCDSNCKKSACGNGIRTDIEACDDGNLVDGDGCDSTCKPSGCGNGVKAGAELCDDGNTTDGDGCDSNCKPTACGNGIKAGAEVCDDGNTTDGDGCDSNCKPTGCGNGVKAGAEQCDDGNTTDGDGCDFTCVPSGCGNGHIVVPEACDDGNTTDGDGCDSNCKPTGCGNGVKAGAEQCDDGNLVDGDGCDSNCKSSGCGNGLVVAPEVCDDGNTTDGDGCDSNCKPTACGNGVRAGAELCDDGNLVNGDGCDSNCKPTGCGNGVKAGAELCDDGNTTDGDGCDSNCKPTACGNGVKVGAELCDDGNLVNGDGCDSNCKPTGCGNGVVSSLFSNFEGGANGWVLDSAWRVTQAGSPAGSPRPFSGTSALGTPSYAANTDAYAVFGPIAAPLGATMSLSTWTNLEAGYDFGEVWVGTAAVPRAGAPVASANMQRVSTAKQWTGLSASWSTATLSLDAAVAAMGSPASVYVYLYLHSDSSTQGLGWFVDDISMGASETCDDGNLVDGDGCDSNCKPTACGNGVRTGTEECDDGSANGATGACSATCTSVTVAQVALGGSHGCALLSTGALKCWGSGGSGRLGYGNTNSLTGAAIATAGAVPVGGTVTQVALGGSHTCVRLDNGGVKCWGDNSYGQLGYGNTLTIGDDETPETVGTVSLGGKAIGISAGYNHSCAVLENGSVVCWGYAQSGKLGYANTNNIGDNELPSSVGPVQLGGTAQQVAAGGSHTCALLTGGAVKCWGYGYQGALGYGNTNSIGDNETPATVGSVSLGGSAIQVVAGDSHTCALLGNGSVRCWGLQNDSAYNLGTLGVPGTQSRIGDDEVPSSSASVAVGGTVSSISAGRTHTCARLGSGTVRCWGGDASSGPLGYARTDRVGYDVTPAVAGDVPLSVGVVSVATGTNKTCVLRADGALSCWGADDWFSAYYLGDDDYVEHGGICPLLPYSQARRTASKVLLTAEKEPNADRSQARALASGDTGWGGSISTVGDQDYFSFSVTAGKSVKLRTTSLFDATSCPGDTLIRLYNSAGTALGMNDNSGVGGTCSLIDPTTDAFARNLPAGTYYVRIEEAGNDSTIGRYQLLVEVTP